ncbi:MAG: LamG domain-containing protein [Usitatibacter sp.]
MAVGVGLFSFALFGNEEGFKAPRWVVAAVALAFITCGGIPLKSAVAEGGIVPDNIYAHLGVAVTFAFFAATLAWMIVAIGPEGVSLDTPISFPHGVERWVKGIVFYGVTSLGALAFLLIAGRSFGRAVPSLGRTAIVAVAAPIAGIAAWVAIEMRGQAAPPQAPFMHLTFDRRFPGDAYLAHPFGDEVFARPGKVGTGLFVGGSGDWLDVEAPRGFDTRNGLTLEFWMKRESWVNPFVKGSRMQTVAAIDVERDYKGHPELRQMSFSLELTAPRQAGEKAGQSEKNMRADFYSFRPAARLGEARVAPAAANVKVTANRWTHVAVVYDRFLVDRVRLYVDGELVARALPFGAAPGFADIRSLRLGTQFERNGAYRGMIDEVKVYARTLSDDEILAEASGRPAPDPMAPSVAKK